MPCLCEVDTGAGEGTRTPMLKTLAPKASASAIPPHLHQHYYIIINFKCQYITQNYISSPHIFF